MVTVILKVVVVLLAVAVAVLAVSYFNLRARLSFQREYSRDLHERVKAEAEQSQEEAARVAETEHSLRKQVQDFAQQLATIKVEHQGATSEEKAHAEYEKPRPLSQALVDFLDGIEFQEARDITSEEVYRLREQDFSDEQILSMIESGTYNG